MRGGLARAVRFMALALAACGMWSSVASADILSLAATNISGQLRVSYQYSAPVPAAAPEIILRDTGNADAQWVFRLSTDTTSTSSATVIGTLPRIVGAASCTLCFASLVSSTTGLQYIPAGQYVVSMRFLNVLGATSTSPTSVFSMSASATVPPPPPTLSSPTPTSGLGGTSLTLGYTLPNPALAITGTSVRGAEAVFRGRGSATCDASTVNLVLTGISSSTPYSLTIPYADPTSATGVLAAASSGTFIRGCTYDAELWLETSLRAPVASQTVRGIVIPEAPSISNVQSSVSRSGVAVSFDLSSPVLPTTAGSRRIVFTNTQGGGSQTLQLSDAATSVDGINVLAAGSYTATVEAANAAGTTVVPVPGTITVAAPPFVNGVQVVAGLSSAQVSWSPATENGTPVTRYVVTTNAPGSPRCVVAPPTTTCTVQGLPPGRHRVTVTAESAYGDGWMSTDMLDSVGGPPGAPTNVSAVPLAGAATVRWQPAPLNGGTMAAYEVTASPGGQSCRVDQPAQAAASMISCVVTGLTNGTPYTFSIVPVADAPYGAGTAATTSAVTPADVPAAPTGVAATTTGTAATITWDAPSAGAGNGSAILGHRAVVSGGSRSCTALAPLRSCTITGLTPGQSVAFVVAARNAMGTGADSAPSAAVTPSLVPDAPTTVVAVASGASASIGWAAPADNGSPITGYAAVTSAGGPGCSAPAGSTTCTVSGLTPGELYAFAVRASNARGQGDLSEATAPVRLGAADPEPSPQPTGPAAAPAPPSVVPDAAASLTTTGKAKKLAIVTTAQVNRAGGLSQVGTALVKKGRKRVPTTVCTGAGTASASAPSTVTCALNATGKSLVRKGALRVTLVTTFTPGSGAPATSTIVVAVPRAGR